MDRYSRARAESLASSASGSGALKLKLACLVNGKRADGACTCQTDPPRRRQLSVIIAENRPDETLVICRTSSIGANVPPPVTTTFILSGSPLLHDSATTDSLTFKRP